MKIAEIKNSDDFIDYLTDRYGECSKTQDIVDVKEYVLRFDYLQLQCLAEIIKDRYDYNKMPKRTHILKLWEQYAKSYWTGDGYETTKYNNREIINKTKVWSHEELIKRLLRVYEKQLKNGPSALKPIEMDFLLSFDMIYYIYTDLRSKGRTEKQLLDYCGAAIETLRRGDEIKYPSDEILSESVVLFLEKNERQNRKAAPKHISKIMAHQEL